MPKDDVSGGAEGEPSLRGARIALSPSAISLLRSMGRILYPDQPEALAAIIGRRLGRREETIGAHSARR